MPGRMRKGLIPGIHSKSWDLWDPDPADSFEFSAERLYGNAKTSNSVCYIFERVMVRGPQKQCSQVSDLVMFDMPNSNRFDILSILIFCKISLSISISILPIGINIDIF